MRVLTSSSETETEAVGRDLAQRLGPGDVVLLEGTLGAGKTAFARGLADGLGCDVSAVSSPTFTIIQPYVGRILMQHVDLYRLTPTEVEDLGLGELGEGALLAVEWPDRWRLRPVAATRVRFDVLPDGQRRITIDDGVSESTGLFRGGSC